MNTIHVRTMLLNTLILFICLFPFCKSRDAITPDQPLKDGDSLISQDNSFELGFFSLTNSTNRYFGIWFGKVAQRTVVWVGNRDSPINDSSGILTINSSGNLVLYGHNNNDIPVWSINVSVQYSNTLVAQLLDSGNLVFVQGKDSGNPLWQSFDYPTDTMLPGMKLGLNRRTGLESFLTSWKSKDDPGTGDYSFRLNQSGSPQFFLSKGSLRLWRLTPWPWNRVRTYNYSFVNNEDETYLRYFSIDPSAITRLVVSDSGSLQRLTWYEVDYEWKEEWAGPKYRCDQYGQCGANSKCSPDNINQFECKCLPGYEPKSPTNWNRRDGSDGCVHKQRVLPPCRRGEGFMTVARVKPPDTSKASWWKTRLDDAECEEACLRNCSCTAFGRIEATEGRFCVAWHGELLDILEYTDGGVDVNIRTDAAELAKNIRKSKSFLKRGMLAIPIVSAVLGLLLIFMCAYWLLVLKKRKMKAGLAELEETRGRTDMQFFHFRTITAATDNYSPANKLGQGGFGSVYKGQLSDGQNIAVKRLSKNSGQGTVEFKTEVMLIAKLQHRNLVKLLGCCMEGEEKMLIYEFVPNRSLDSFIFDQKRRPVLDWTKRFNIITGVARGILYLHHDSRLRIIHRDLKTSNVLLDADMNPKISDFGMARIFDKDQIQDKTNRVVGTLGYMSPEYAVLGKFSIKSDVFSFGVILLEIVSGKKNTELYEEAHSLSMLGHVWNIFREDRAFEIVDSSLESYNSEEVLRCIQVGLLCVQEEANDRPTMSDVVLMLSSETALPSPQQPPFLFRKQCHDEVNVDPSSSGVKFSVNDVTISKLIAR